MTTTPAELPASKSATVLPAWLWTSAGVSAALVGIGYLVQAARDHLLGLQLRTNLAIADYGLLGGRFFVEVITLVLRTLGLHPVLTPAVVLAAGTVFYLLARRARHALSFAGIMTRLVVIVLLLVTKAAAFDVPTALIDNVLVEGADQNRVFDASPLLGWSTNLLWREMLCAHAPVSFHQQLGCGDITLAQHRLDALFLANLIVTLVLATWTGAILRHVGQVDSAESLPLNALQVATGVAILALVIALLALPYQYGKLIEPIRFNRVQLYFSDTDKSSGGTPAQQVTPAVASTTIQPPATSTGAPSKDDEDEREMLTGSVLLLASDSDVLTLYVEEDDKVREVSRDEIESVKVYPARDVLTAHIDYFFTKKGAGQR